MLKGYMTNILNPLSANYKKWPNTLKQFVGKKPKNCLSVFDHFVVFALKRLNCLLCSFYNVSASPPPSQFRLSKSYIFECSECKLTFF